MRKRYLITSLICFGIALLAALHMGCVADRTLHKKTMLTVEVNVVGSTKQYDVKEARERRHRGYCHTTQPPRIFLTGYRTSKGVTVDDPWVLGHEILEALRAVDYEWSNPDE